MAENKKSFILYVDLVHTVRKMSKQKAGELFMTILGYVNDENPIVTDKIIDLVFEPIKQQLKRDLKDWETERIKRSKAGKLGGIKSGISRRNEAKRSSASKNEANEADNVNVNDNVTVNVNDSVNVINNIMWTSIKKNFLEDGPWQLKILTEKKISLAALEKKQNEFLSDIELKEDFKELRDLKNHFINWFNKQKNSNGSTRTNSANKGKSTGAYELLEQIRSDSANNG